MSVSAIVVNSNVGMSRNVPISISFFAFQTFHRTQEFCQRRLRPAKFLKYHGHAFSFLDAAEGIRSRPEYSTAAIEISNGLHRVSSHPPK